MSGWLQNEWIGPRVSLVEQHVEQVSEHGWLVNARYEPCPQHPSGTRPSASGTQEQGETTHTPAPSVDTDDAGTGRQTHG